MEVDPPITNQDFLDSLNFNFSRISFEDKERMMHSHGHCLQDVFSLRYGKFKRFVDCVLYPSSTKHVQKIVELANENNVVIVPYGGGTNVTQALQLPEDEGRMIISLDMTRMNKIKWVDRANMTACIESGIIGSDLERELKKYDVVLTFGPDETSLREDMQKRLQDEKVVFYLSNAGIVNFAKLIANFKLFVSTSTGTYHLASLVGTPTMTFFGDSNFASAKRWKSIGDEKLQKHYMLPMDAEKRAAMFERVRKELLSL